MLRFIFIIIAFSLFSYPAFAGFFVNLPPHHNLLGNKVYIRIFKDERVLELYVQKNKKFNLIKTYPICSYSGGLGPKKHEGDMKSPEGFYHTSLDSLNPNSRYHLSFNIGYPNAYDQLHGYTGKFLMIHGECVSQGCYAIENSNIEEVYRFVESALFNGQERIDVHIYPFKMTEQKLKRYQSSEHYDFWTQLKPGYDFFEDNNLPPQVFVINNRYMLLPGRIE